MFPPCELSYMGILQPTAPKAGKLWFSPRPAKRLYLRLDHRASRSRGLFTRTGHGFPQNLPSSVFILIFLIYLSVSLFKGLLHFGRI